jgi:hypothetical protein
LKVADEPVSVLPGAGLLRTAGADAPVPLRLMTAEALEDELLAMVSVPLAAPEAFGSNWTVSVAV